MKATYLYVRNFTTLFKSIALCALVFFINTKTSGQLVINTSMTPAQLVQNILVGSGVTVSGITYSGASNSIGYFSTSGTPTNLGLTSGIVLSTGNVTQAAGAVSGFASTVNSTGSDPQLASLVPGYTINDASVLQFNFIPQSDTIRFRYVFASEEYPEWVNTSFNDVFGFFVTGPNPVGGTYSNKNIALIPGTSLPVTIDNVNNVGSPYSMYYVDNQGTSGQYVVYDGFTTVLTAWTLVTPCMQYSIKIAVGDAGDASYDSAVFLEESSFSSTGIAISTTYSQPSLGTNSIEGCSDAIIGFKLPKPTPVNLPVNISIGGTAVNGADYTQVSTTLFIPAGQDSTSLTINPILDNILEGFETVQLIVQTSACGKDTVIIYIYDNTTLTSMSSQDTTICGQSATISAYPYGGLTPYTYSWSNNAGTSQTVVVSPSATTTYTVTVNDACGQSATEQVIVSLGSGVALACNDTAICIGGTANLYASGGTGYQWSNGVNSASNPVSPTVQSTYTVIVSGVCDGFDTVVVSVNPLPTPSTTISPLVICAGETSNITASGGNTYLWSSSPNDASLSGQMTSSTPVVSPQFTTTYTVTVTDANTCTNTANVILTVSPSPAASYIANPSIVSLFDPVVNFIDNSSGNPSSWSWTLGDGTFENTPDFTHTYIAEGTYLITLYVENDYGCSDSTSGWLTVQPDFSFWVPNAFTPNSDGINEEFNVYSLGISEKSEDFKLQIFDRWGQLVFNTNDITEGWTGKINGVKAPEGVYAYRIFYKDATKLKHVKYGHITLYR